MGGRGVVTANLSKVLLNTADSKQYKLIPVVSIKRMLKRKRNYYCSKCGKKVVRTSNKQWIKSYCETFEKDTRITLVRTKKQFRVGKLWGFPVFKIVAISHKNR